MTAPAPGAPRAAPGGEDAPGAGGWHGANQRFLTAAMELLRGLLERHAAARGSLAPAIAAAAPAGVSSVADLARAMPAPPALLTIARQLQLTPFESDLLLLCAAVELDPAFGVLCAAALGARAERAQPTFGLALGALPGGHWSALTPTAPLRRLHLIELGAGGGLTDAPLRIEERVLHAVVGVDYLDERLATVVAPAEERTPEVASQRALADELAALLAPGGRDAPVPVVQLLGKDASAKLEVASAAARSGGRRLATLSARALPAATGDLAALARLWNREAVLGGHLLLVDCDRGGPGDGAAVHRFIDRLAVPVLIAARERLRDLVRPALVLDVPRPTAREQHALWAGGLARQVERGPEEPPAAREELASRLAAHFDLGASAVEAACASAAGRVARGEPLRGALWTAARAQARARLDDLAQRIEARAGWRDLVLPAPQLAILRQVSVHARQRTRVYEAWGLGGQGGRGLGISALFSGPSGTGKTLAAEVIAAELELDLFRIDLSQVVSKYIGETEKNLRSVFDAAEEGGAILLFDEADALFGKRSEVKDSHDRFANIEIGYLLQRMEAYRGLAILTTNLRSALDSAFLRRIRFFVQFPFPSAAERREIWRRVFPAAVPTAPLDLELLTRLNVAGGTIRSIAVNAAFLAADAGEPVRMEHLLRAAEIEYAKLERPLTAAEFGAWPSSDPPAPG